MPDAPVRPFQELTVPQAGPYEIDPSHPVVESVVRHLGLAKVRGRFNSFHGTVEIGEDPLASRVDVVIEAASIDRRDEGRDAHLRTPTSSTWRTVRPLELHSRAVRLDGP